VSFQVAPGECLLVVGPSGSGKSTLALALAGLVPRERPGDWRGSIELDGASLAALAPAAVTERAGIVFQHPASQLVMDRVEDDVAFGLENRGWPLEAMRRRVPEALAEVGLAGLERGRPNRLSGGQQQRLALAGVLAAGPGLLVLDEPTANLDPDGTEAFFDRLAGLRAGRAATIVLVEHRMERAWPLADRILALGADGSPIDEGVPGEVVARSGEAMRRAGIWLPAAIESALDRAAGRTGTPAGTGGAAGAAGAAVGAAGAADVGGGRPLVVAEGVTFGYERANPVIRDVSVQVAEGERVALVGANGSGKSTLARLLVGLLRPDRGRVALEGDDPWRLPARELAQRAGFVFQDPEQQFIADQVAGEVMLGLRPEERPAAEALMDRLGLPLGAFAERNPYSLSGGEQRRLSLASVLVRRPRVLVLDEPTFGQDRHGYGGLVEILRERAASGTCLIAATHDPRFVRDVTPRAITISGGRVVADGPVADGPVA
jgi:energy-coupling factor transport system ATP-binding protein